MPFIGSISGAQGYGRSASVGFPIWVSSGSLGTLTDAQRAAGNTFTVSASPGPGAASVTYSLVTGSLPAGSSLNGTSGLISGFSAVASNTTSNFTLRATNNAGLTADAALSITINGAVVTFNSPAAGSLGTFTSGAAFSQTYNATATSGTVSYSIVSGTIPTGTSFNGTTGAHTGTVNSGSSQTFSYTVRATTTSASATADRAFSVTESSSLFAFTSNTFTAAGQNGTDGVGIATYRSVYAPSQPWANNGSYFFQGRFTGYQVFTVPATGTYRITATGALGGFSGGGPAGQGAIVRADFTLTQNQQLEMVCGHVANSGGTGSSKSGAGGGTFVVFYNTSTPLIIAGGGGGTYSTDSPTENKNGQLRQVPNAIGVSYATAPAVSAGSGNYGWDAGGGGGLTSNGLQNPNGGNPSGSPNGNTWGRGFTNAGCIGGTANTGTSNDFGGFGGGGGGHTGANGGGGGGGYTGGRGGGGSGSTTTTGSGGGSYIRPTGVSNVATSNGQFNSSSTFNGSPITNLGTFNSSGAGTVVIQKL